MNRNNPSVNNYNPDFLLAWGANIDVQFIPSAYRAAEYVSKYLTKNEPGSKAHHQLYSEIFNKLAPDTPGKSFVHRVLMKTMKDRDYGLSEIFFYLSRTVKFFHSFVHLNPLGDRKISLAGPGHEKAIEKTNLSHHYDQRHASLELRRWWPIGSMPRNRAMTNPA